MTMDIYGFKQIIIKIINLQINQVNLNIKNYHDLTINNKNNNDALAITPDHIGGIQTHQPPHNIAPNIPNNRFISQTFTKQLAMIFHLKYYIV